MVTCPRFEFVNLVVVNMRLTVDNSDPSAVAHVRFYHSRESTLGGGSSTNLQDPLVVPLRTYTQRLKHASFKVGVLTRNEVTWQYHFGRSMAGDAILRSIISLQVVHY